KSDCWAVGNGYRTWNSCLRSPHRGTNRTLRDSISVPQLVFFPRLDRRQCRDLLAALDEERLVTKALADCRRFGGSSRERLTKPVDGISESQIDHFVMAITAG